MNQISTDASDRLPRSRRLLASAAKFVSLGLLFLGLGTLSAGAEQKPVTSWGVEAGMVNPADTAVAPNGTIFVADLSEQRVQKFSRTGGLIKEWGKDGINDGEFKNPSSVEVDSDGNVYVPSADSRIQKFDSDGKFLAKWGKPGIGDGQFLNPAGIAIDGSGRIYVADSGNQRIQVFRPDLTFLMKWGEPGIGEGQFMNPKGIAIDAQGNVYVSDTGNNRIQKFTIKDDVATYVTSWGAKGDGPGQFDEPTGLAISGSGNLFVADTGNSRIQEISSSTGEFISSVGSKGSQPGEVYLPTGLDTGQDGEIYVADSGNQRVQLFAITPDKATALSISPASPGVSLAPKITGKAPVGEFEVDIFTSNDCSGDPVAKGPASAFNGAGIELNVAKASTTTFRARVKDSKFGLFSACSDSSVSYTQKDKDVIGPDPDPDTDLGPISGPTVTTATFDGVNLHVRLKCPARFKPKCVSRAVPVTARGAKGKAMAKVKKVTIRSNRWMKATFAVKPAFRAKVQAMTKVDARRLVVRQRIRSKRLGKRKNRKTSTAFHVYKVRVQG